MVRLVLVQGLRMRYDGLSEKSIASGTRVFQRKPFKALEMSCVQQPTRFDPGLTPLNSIKSIQDHHMISVKFSYVHLRSSYHLRKIKTVGPQFFGAL